MSVTEPPLPPPDAPHPEATETDGEQHGAGIRGLVRDLLSLNRGALAILVAVPVLMTLLDYYGMPWQYPQKHSYERRLRPQHREWQMRPMEAPLSDTLKDIEMPGPRRVKPYVWWGICCLLFLVALPMLVARLFARQTPRDLGIRLKGTRKDAKTYLLLYLIFLPVIYLVSLDPAFKRTYPFYKVYPGESLTEGFLLFEIIYCTQFFAVEFFFRGFMVLGLKRYIGWASVLVMLAPYCMIHYYKPMPEAMGAIGAGLVLGALSYRTGTILYGWALHFGVALTMDLLALHHLGLL